MAKPTRFRNKWRIRWTDEHGQRRSEVYSTQKDAEFALTRHQLQVEEIRRGLRSLTPIERTFDELADYWMAKRAIKKRHIRDDESIIRCHLRPFFGKMKLREIGVASTDEFEASRSHLNKKTISNHLTLLISMLNLAFDLGWLERKPRIRKPKIRVFDKDFRYLRTSEEIQKFLLAANDEGPLIHALYSTAVFTGMRQGELAGLQWSDINLDERRIVVQRSFDGPTKAGDVRYIPILDPLLPILRNWRLRCPGRYAFPNQAGKMQQRSARAFKQVFHRVLSTAGFKKMEHEGKPAWHIRFHDLRHTFASHWVMNGGDIFKLQKILGHKSIQMTQRYSHLAPNAFVGDYARLGASPPGTIGSVVSIQSL